MTCGQAGCEGPSCMGGGVLPGRKPRAPGDRSKAGHKVPFSAPSFLLFSKLERAKRAERRVGAPSSQQIGTLRGPSRSQEADGAKRWEAVDPVAGLRGLQPRDRWPHSAARTAPNSLPRHHGVWQWHPRDQRLGTVCLCGPSCAASLTRAPQAAETGVAGWEGAPTGRPTAFSSTGKTPRAPQRALDS